MKGYFHRYLSLVVMQQEALYNMASQLSAAAQLRSAQTLHFGQMLGQPTQFGMPGGMSAIQQVSPQLHYLPEHSGRVIVVQK
jgi:hypothetical protein